MMKKLMIILLAVLMLLGTAGCGSKEKDELSEALDKYLVEEIFADPMHLVSGNGEIVLENGADSSNWDPLNKAMKKTTWTIKDRNVTDDTAEVTVVFKSVDLGATLKPVVDGVAEEIVAYNNEHGGLEGFDTIECMNRLWPIEVDKQVKAGLTFSNEYTFKMIKDADKGWIVAEDTLNDDVFRNIISGGLFVALQKLRNE